MRNNWSKRRKGWTIFMTAATSLVLAVLAMNFATPETSETIRLRSKTDWNRLLATGKRRPLRDKLGERLLWPIRSQL